MTNQEIYNFLEALLDDAMYLYGYYPNNFRKTPDEYFSEAIELLAKLKEDINKENDKVEQIDNNPIEQPAEQFSISENPEPEMITKKELFELIQRSLQATEEYTTSQCAELAQGILEYISLYTFLNYEKEKIINE